MAHHTAYKSVPGIDAGLHQSQKRARSESPGDPDENNACNSSFETTANEDSDDTSSNSSVEIIINVSQDQDERPVQGGKRPPPAPRPKTSDKAVPHGTAATLLHPNKRRATAQAVGRGRGKTISQTVPMAFEPRDDNMQADDSNDLPDAQQATEENTSARPMSVSPAPEPPGNLFSSANSAMLGALNDLDLAQSQSGHPRPSAVSNQQQQQQQQQMSQAHPQLGAYPFPSALNTTPHGFLHTPQSHFAQNDAPPDGQNRSVFSSSVTSQPNGTSTATWWQTSSGPTMAPMMNPAQSVLGQSQAASFNITITPSSQPITLTFNWGANGIGGQGAAANAGPFGMNQQLNVSVTSSDAQVQTVGSSMPERQASVQSHVSKENAPPSPARRHRRSPSRESVAFSDTSTVGSTAKSRRAPLRARTSNESWIQQPVTSEAGDVSMDGSRSVTPLPDPPCPVKSPGMEFDEYINENAAFSAIPRVARHRSPGDISVPSPSKYGQQSRAGSPDARMASAEENADLLSDLFRGYFGAPDLTVTET